MKWFAVNCIYQIIFGDGLHSPQFNEQVRLIEAENIRDAITKAKQFASGYNPSFRNSEGKNVVWNFVDVGGIIEIKQPKDGVEVSSKILEPESIEAYLKNLKYRNKILTKLNT